MRRLFLLFVLVSSAGAQFTPPTYTPSNLFTNAGTTGTALNKLAKLNAANTVVRTATTDTDTALGICVANCGTTGKSVIQWAGIVSCVFDGATTLGNWVTISSSTAGDCHDAGSTRPAATQVIGIVTTTNGGGGTYPVNLQLSGPLPISGTGTVTSITLAGTSNQITVSGTCTVTTSGTCTFTLPSGLVLPGTINKLTLTAPATGATVTIVDGKTFTVNKTLTFDGSDGVTITFPASNATVATLGLTNTFTGRQDASGAASTAPAKVGTSLPGTCITGDAYFKSDATAGSNWYGCTSSNTWTMQGGTGSGNVTAAGTLTSGKVVIGQGSEGVATTGVSIDGSDNVTTSGSVTTGDGASTTGALDLKGKTSGSTVTLTVSDTTGAGTLKLPGATGLVPYVAAARTSGHCAQFDTDGIGLADAGAACGTGSGSTPGPQFNVTTPPTSFTSSVNIGTSSLTSIAGGAAVSVFFQAAGSDQVRGFYNAKPASTYTVTLGCLQAFRNNTCSLLLYDTGTTKSLVMVEGNDGVMHCFYFSSPTVYGGADQCGQSFSNATNNPVYYKIVEDGTHRTFYISPDGYQFTQVSQVASGTNLTPDSVGIGVDVNGTFGALGSTYQMFSYSSQSGVH